METNKLMHFINDKEQFAQSTFLKSIINHRCRIDLVDGTTIDATLLQADMYTIIVEPEPDQFLLIFKSNILAIEMPNDKVVEFKSANAATIQKILYKKSEQRSNVSKNKPYEKPKPPTQATKPEPQVIVKKKFKLERP